MGRPSESSAKKYSHIADRNLIIGSSWSKIDKNMIKIITHKIKQTTEYTKIVFFKSLQNIA